MNVWDVGGQKSIRTFWKNYFEQTEGLVWVVDCSDRSRLEICKQEMSQVEIFLQNIFYVAAFFFIKKPYVHTISIQEIYKLQ